MRKDIEIDDGDLGIKERGRRERKHSLNGKTRVFTGYRQ
jgi:hypothetical protein